MGDWQKKNPNELKKLYRLELGLAVGMGRKLRTIAKDLTRATLESELPEDLLYFSRLAYLQGDTHRAIF